MTILLIGLAVFLGIHSVAIVTPRLRARAVASMGLDRWRGVYSLVSAVGFALILYGFHLARQAPVVLYTAPVWMRHVTFLVMLPVFPLILAAYLPGRIKSGMKHPMLAAVKFWTLAHLLSNGMLADVLLFGSFLAWAVWDRISLKRRPQQPIATAPPGRFNDLIAVIAGLALYTFFVLWAHVWLFGRELRVPIPLSLDDSGDDFRRFDVTKVPTALIADDQGRIVSKVAGDDLGTPNALRTALGSL